MTALTSGEEFQQIKMRGVNISEILFADDTLIFAKNKESIEELFWTVEVVSGIYGMNLNKCKCIEIGVGIEFEDGQPVARKHNAEHLGSKANEKPEPCREVNRLLITFRFAEDKLNVFWREDEVKKKWKISMCQAIACSKLTYGLKVLPLKKKVLFKMDAFFYRGLRRILALQITYVDRKSENKNEVVLAKANEEIDQAQDRNLLPSQIFQNKAAALID